MSSRILDTSAALSFPLRGVRLIEASAGTGKTYTIANLYLRHILAGREVGDVLVVTFTVAATDELRGRIRMRLFETLNLLDRQRESGDVFLSALVGRIREQGSEELVSRRLRLAVRAIDEAAIYTIHGFCQRALSEFAFNSGQRFEMEVLTDDGDLWREAVQDWWRRNAYPLDPARARLLASSLGDLAAFRRLLTPLLGPQRKRLLPETDSMHSVLARFDGMALDLKELSGHWQADGERLRGILSGSEGLSRARAGPYHRDRLALTFPILERYFAREPMMPPGNALEVLSAGCIARHRLRKPDPALEDPFFAQCERVWQGMGALGRDLRAAALAEASAFARGAVHDAKQDAQLLSFDDLLSEMDDALRRESGRALARAVRDRFPVAMIDEFQDTDPVQYEIFRMLYRDQPDCSLIMIGDPKQAIYSFRGGDIFTYMRAKADVEDGGVYTLTTNWRSSPPVINAVNRVFGRRPVDAFVFAGTIPFLPTMPAEREHRYLSRDGERQAALTLWSLPVALDAKGAEKALSKEAARERTHAAVASEIARLIAGGREGRVRVGPDPLLPRDIAVLVRTSREAAELRQSLAVHGVSAVSVERGGVFASDEAGALEVLLRAVLDPRDRDAARLALTSPLLGLDYVEIEGVISGEHAWVDWLDRLLRARETWQRKGFMPMFQALLRDLRIAEALSRGELPERRLTNLLHLGELLQQASKGQAGMDALVSWYRHRRAEAAPEEAELRLESDEELVQIVTVHASKGLEYPVVFVPYLWSCRTRGRDGLLSFHREGGAFLDAGSDDFDANLLLAERERLAEDVRLAYVALTRAESALYLVWGRAGSRDGHAGQTALGYLLHPHQDGARLARERPDAFAGPMDPRDDLRVLADKAAGDILVVPLPDPDAGPLLSSDAGSPDLAPRAFAGHIAADWRVSSFSALTRDVHSGPGLPRDETADDVGMRFPAGSHVGSYLHLLLEKLDFQGDVEGQILALSAGISPRFNLDHARWGSDSAALLARVVRTPLDPSGLRLADLRLADRLNELEFDFATRAVDVPSLNRLLREAAGRPLPPLEIETFRGMVNGVVDLVFEHAGRFYIADYKSNFLGCRFADYQGERLRAAVYERRYDLQYLLYTLALHRYLGRRMATYDYERHFGGVYYLFLRGMRPETGPATGVYQDRPGFALVDALDRQVFAFDRVDSA